MFDEHHNLFFIIKSRKLLSPSCIEAEDKNPIEIQIRVLVFTDARHNQDGRAQ